MNNNKLNKVHVFKSLSHSKINAWINKHNVKVLQLLNLEDNKLMILYEELGKPVKENVLTRNKILYEYNNEDKKKHNINSTDFLSYRQSSNEQTVIFLHIRNIFFFKHHFVLLIDFLHNI